MPADLLSEVLEAPLFGGLPSGRVRGSALPFSNWSQTQISLAAAVPSWEVGLLGSDKTDWTRINRV